MTPYERISSRNYNVLRFNFCRDENCCPCRPPPAWRPCPLPLSTGRPTSLTSISSTGWPKNPSTYSQMLSRFSTLFIRSKDSLQLILSLTDWLTHLLTPSHYFSKSYISFFNRQFSSQYFITEFVSIFKNLDSKTFSMFIVSRLPPAVLGGFVHC